VKRALLIALLLAGCKQQDAALFITVTGPFIIPSQADTLSMEVYENSTQIASKQWTLPVQATLNQSITVVEGGGAHPHVKINMELFKGNVLVGQGTDLADFQDGTTVPVSITMSRSF
jgi:hypothetical protein